MNWIVSLFLFIGFHVFSPSQSTEITHEVFGNDIEILPAAFGDFNSDELTDLFVLRNNSKTIEILLGSNEGRFLFQASNLKCTFSRCNLTSVVPGDFNGDALMDVLVTTKCSKEENWLNVHVLWGESNSLNCSFNENEPILKLKGEPLALDGNDDFIIDLFGVNATDEKKGIWLFSNSSQPVFQPLSRERENLFKIRDPHSNAYLDLNNDNVADLFLTFQNQESYHFEIWHKSSSNFKFYERIPAPMQARKKLGQSLFLDLELEGKMNLIVPVIDKNNPKILVYDKVKWVDLNVNFKLDGKIWYFLEPGAPFSKAVTLRGGDYNMDGYPDLLATLTTSGNQKRTFLFKNVPCLYSCEGLKRSFEIQWDWLSKNITDSVAGIFCDIFHDGILDVILIRQYQNGSYYVSAFKNNLDYDANFIKVMVLTGLTNKNSFNVVKSSVKKKTFGTNLPGPRAAYQTVDQEGFLRTGVSAQLPQSAHFSLNLPYIMFALGRTPNFVDNITVGLSSHHKDLPQVIPNSQMVVIPVPISNPSKWRVQLFVTPSNAVLLSAMTLIGICFLIIIIIIILHWQEKKTDRLERLQEAHRFNFDAM